MRPVIRGDCPQDENRQDIQFSKYQQARGFLIKNIGEFCSYCEMHLDAGLAVEHVQPKDLNPSLELNWDNFLLACTNCNSTKGKSPINLGDYLWPDKDNTFRAFNYQSDGIITAVTDRPFSTQAQNTIELVGLDKSPLTAEASDRRWLNRK